jgi:dTDP-4-dehydrorhamnose 3,5-epimerase
VSLVATTYNAHALTLRGMHFQREPFAETKLVRVTRGRIFDVAIDLRPGSPTSRHWHGVELSADNGQQFYIPKGFAHGYLTLEDHCELSYVLSAPYSAEHATGYRFDDPAFAIRWPAVPKVIHPRDAGYALIT